MKSTLPFVGLAVAATLASAVPPPTTTEDALDLSTRYTEGLRLRLDAELTYESERTAFEMIRDGEPVDFGDRMMGGPSLLTRWTSSVYGVEAVEDGAPVDVRLGFERLEQETFAIRRDEEVVDTTNSPLEEVVLGLTLEDGEVVAEVLEGSEPDDEALLEGFSMDLGLDALLPEGPVEPGAEWDVEGAALVRALSFDLEAQLFPPSPRPELGAEGGGRGGRGGFRGMRGGGGGNLGHLVIGLHAHHGKAHLLHEASAGHGAGPMIHPGAGLTLHCGPVVLAEGTLSGDALEDSLGHFGEDRGLFAALSLGSAHPGGPESTVEMGVKHSAGLEYEVHIQDFILVSNDLQLIGRLIGVPAGELSHLASH